MNKYRPHVFILCEDDANRQIVNGFLLDPSLNERAIQVLPLAGGWQNVLDDFKNKHLNAMSSNLNQHTVLLVDFDNKDNRLAKVKEIIPESLTDRVFVLGVLSEPEDLRRAGLGSFEDIGTKLAKDCRENTTTLWSHELLQHNVDEVQRMTPVLRPILFPQA